MSKLSALLLLAVQVILFILWILYVVRLIKELRGKKLLTFGIVTIIVLIAIAFLCMAADLPDWGLRLIVLAMAAFVLFSVFVAVQHLRELFR